MGLVPARIRSFQEKLEESSSSTLREYPIQSEGGKCILIFKQLIPYVKYANGQFLFENTGGHLPFEVELPSPWKSGQVYILTVAVDNQLHPASIPPGFVSTHEYQE